MNSKKRLVLIATAAIAVSACDALTAHVDTVARAGSEELTASRLAELMASADVPQRKDVALAIANIWVNYHLLAYAAAQGDTLGDAKTIDDAMWAQIAQRRSQKFNEALGKTIKPPTPAETEKAYNDGALLAAQHILISADRATLKADKIDEAKRKATDIRKQVTAGNFAAMAKKYSADPGSKDNGGEYVFPKKAMVREFEQTTMSLKQGEISDPVQTDYGFHIIRRETYAEAKPKFDTMYAKMAVQLAESTFLDNMVTKNKVEVKPGAAKLLKDVVTDVDRYRDDRTVVATSSKVDMRVGRVAHWIAAMPPNMQARQQIAKAPDSLVEGFVKNLMQNELLLKAADSAKIQMDSTEMNQLRSAFRGSIASSLNGLNVSPAKLGDSAKSTAEKEKLASRRVDNFLERLIKGQAQFVDVSEPVTIALRRKFAPRVVAAGIDRAIAQAATLKKTADSTKDASLPKSVVPMPGPAGAAPADPKGAAPAAAKEPAKDAAKEPAKAAPKKP